MRALITGGAGFIGSHLAKHLCDEMDTTVFDKEREVRIDERADYIRGDITDYLSLAKAFEQTKPDLVFHLAGMVSRKECEETPLLAFQTNMMGAYNICELCVRHKARVIYAGSSEEYGHGFTDTKVTESTSFGPATGIYSLTKRFADEVIQHFAAKKGLTATAVRFFMLYGPGEPANPYRSAAIRFISYAMKGEPLPVHGGTSRSWCYIDDAIEALMLLARREQTQSYELYNIGKNEPIETPELARLILTLTESKSEIVLTEPDPTIIPHKSADFGKIKAVLGWEATTPLETGLKHVIRHEKHLAENDLRGRL
jgi:nucleoside-diphosphate-sugar epimerase